MDWTRSETLALAFETCSLCHGLGLRWDKVGLTRPCNCVFRSIFRACYERFRRCLTKEKYVSQVSLDHNTRTLSRNVWGRKNEEYIADFCLVSRRSLSDAEYRIFKYHFLLGAEWKLCCTKLNLDRGTFFHDLYRIEEKLGRVYRELQPYSLYPIEDYFSTGQNIEPSRSVRVKSKVIPFRRPLRPPVSRATPAPEPALELVA